MYRFLIIIFLIFVFSCSAKKQDVPNSLAEYLKNLGVQDIHKDFEFNSPNLEGKKYMALTVTYNFSTAEGKAQKEYLGFILRQENQDWKIEKNTAYTVNEQKAKDLLAGAK